MDNSTSEADKPEEVNGKEPASSAYWLRELDAYAKRFRKWQGTARDIERRYEEADERGEDARRMNVLWSNTETLHSAVYGQTAKPDIRRRFPDKNSKSGLYRTVAEVLERSVDYCLDVYDVDEPINAAVQDHLLTGRGQAWVDYEPVVVEDQIAAQDTQIVYVHWKDFAHGFGKRWKDVTWVARKRHGTRQKIEKIIGGKLPDDIKPEHLDTGDDQEADKDDALTRYAVWEIWDKIKRERLYVMHGYAKVIRTDPDPLGLKGFFPCPRPLYGPMGTRDLIPTPEFELYRDQADEIDSMTCRIAILTREVKWRGFARSSGPEGKDLPDVASAVDGEFPTIEIFPGESGRALWDSIIAEQPIDRLVQVIAELRAHRAEALQTIYEITGISDIIRGSSDPGETATAQRIKGQFGSMRIKRRQREVQRFIRDLYRIKSELIAEHWTSETFSQVTGFDFPTAQAKQMASAEVDFASQMGMPPSENAIRASQAEMTWDEILEVLRSDAMRSYAVDVETDSTVFEDAEAEKQARVEFTGALTAMIERAGVMIQTYPQSVPLVKEITLFGVRGFKAGRHLEENIEEAFDSIQQALMQPQEKQPDPKLLEVERKAKRDAADIQQQEKDRAVDVMKVQSDQEAKTAEAAMDALSLIDQIENKPEPANGPTGQPV